VSLLGVLIALLGLTGFWLSSDAQRTVLSAAERELLNPTGDAFQLSFVLAGRDYDYDKPAGPLVRRGDAFVRSYVTQARLGNRTDTIMYVNIVGNRVFMISIPRDVMLSLPGTAGAPARAIGINEVYEYPALYGGASRADALRRAVAELLDLPVDYYVVINIDIFERLVDDLGGVELEVPRRMRYSDQAGGL
jgi:polyisoprenyl-teichoic acid--peptidoglycan teichoic acid transferase